MKKTTDPHDRFAARDAALRILSFADNNRASLIRKLRLRGFAPSLCEEVADECIARGLISEEDQLHRQVLTLAGKKLWGRRKILASLRFKGYAGEDILRALAEAEAAGEIDFRENARLLVEKKLDSEASADEKKALLYRYGY